MDESKLYEQINNELSRLYDHIVKAFEQLRNKALALLVGEVAIATFLFQDFHINIGQKNNPPVYGYAILGIGILLLVMAYAFFLYVISTIRWRYPTEEHDLTNPSVRFNSSPLEYQKYLHAEYMEKIPFCNKKVIVRARIFMYGTYALSTGVLLVILVKYGGGA